MNDPEPIARFCEIFHLPMPLLSKDYVYCVNTKSLTPPFGRAVSILIKDKWDCLRWHIELCDPPQVLYHGNSSSWAALRVRAYFRADYESPFFSALLPEIRQLIRQHLDPWARLRLQQTCLACHKEDYVFELPRILRDEADTRTTKICIQRAFRVMALEWMENFSQPCFQWLATALASFFDEHKQRTNYQVIGIFSATTSRSGENEFATWCLHLKCYCPNESPECKGSRRLHQAKLTYERRNWSILFFGCRKCLTKNDLFHLEADASTLAELWRDHGAFIINALLLDQRSDEWKQSKMTKTQW